VDAETNNPIDTTYGTDVGDSSVDNAADYLDGGAGNDSLFGGAGGDTLTGGGGNDSFVYTTASDSTAAHRDTIKDFDDVGNDRIELFSVYSGVLTWRGVGAFTGIHQVRIHDIAGPDVLVEVNLSGTLAPEMVIRLAATTAGSMTSSDFIL
jgi:RTX calcium-binding nonapeptide repeat (4 copies)